MPHRHDRWPDGLVAGNKTRSYKRLRSSGRTVHGRGMEERGDWGGGVVLQPGHMALTTAG